MFSKTMSKKEAKKIARNIMAFRAKSAPYDLYSDPIVKHLLLLPWFVEALIRRALLLSKKCRIKCTHLRSEMNESITSSFSKEILKSPTLDSRLLVKYKEPGKKERSIMMNVEVQKWLGIGLMARLAYYLSALLRDQIKRGWSFSLLHKVYTVTIICQNMARFRDKPEQYLHFTCGDELLERSHKDKNMVQHVFLEVNKFNKDTDGVNRDGCLFEAFMYTSNRCRH